MPIHCLMWMMHLISCLAPFSSVVLICPLDTSKLKLLLKTEVKQLSHLEMVYGNTYTLMPFGLKNAPPTFQHLMELVLVGLDWESCLVYLDDILLFSPSSEDHLLLLEEVFKKLRCANLKLKPEKCNLFKKEVVYLGHLVSGDGVHPDPGNVEKVRNWRCPSNAEELRSFLGLASY